MSGIYGSHMEDRHFEGLLNAYLDKVDEAEEYDEYIEEKVKGIMAEGGDYYPYTFDNFQEAIAEASGKELLDITNYLAVCDTFNGNDDTDNELLFKAINSTVKAYWYDAAKKHVEGLL